MPVNTSLISCIQFDLHMYKWRALCIFAFCFCHCLSQFAFSVGCVFGNRPVCFFGDICFPDVPFSLFFGVGFWKPGAIAGWWAAPAGTGTWVSADVQADPKAIALLQEDSELCGCQEKSWLPPSGLFSWGCCCHAASLSSLPPPVAEAKARGQPYRGLCWNFQRNGQEYTWLPPQRGKDLEPLCEFPG